MAESQKARPSPAGKTFACTDAVLLSEVLVCNLLLHALAQLHDAHASCFISPHAEHIFELTCKSTSSTLFASAAQSLAGWDLWGRTYVQGRMP